MSDTFNFDDFDADYFAKLYEQIGTHPGWKLANPSTGNHSETDTSQYRSLAEDAATSRSEQEIVIDHAETEGNIVLTSPVLGPDPKPVTGALYHNIGLSEPRHGADYRSFEVDLKSVHREIAKEGDAAYAAAVEDDGFPSIATIVVPFEYEDDQLDESLTYLDTTSREIQQLHDELRSVLDQYK